MPPQRPEPPAVKNTAWPRNPIDNFILAKLEAAGLTPAPEADRRTLARRVSLDLTGLPPDPALVEAFVNDPSPDAYEALVDRLLESSAWGEHRARYWLDAARYADTHGIHFDNFREIWVYRDWVIDAFNRNLPFDQFTIEQLAGDLLPNATLEQQIASGFNRCNITTNEGGIIDEEYLVLYARDRTETASLVWMGATAGCAVCHDHKFDPLSQREFYELAAFFNNTTQGARDGNIKDTPPIVRVAAEADRPRYEDLKEEIPKARQALEARRKSARPEFDTWLASAQPAELAKSIPTEALYLHAPLNEGAGKTLHVTVDHGEPAEVQLAGSATWQAGPAGGKALQPQGAACELSAAADFEEDQAFTLAAWVKLPANDGYGAICARMDNGNEHRGWDFWMQRRQVGTHIIHRWPDNALKVVGKNQVPANEWTHVVVSYDGSQKAAGVKVYYNGQEQPTLVEADKLSETIRTNVPFKIGQRNTSEPLSGAAIQDLRIYTRTLSAGEVASLGQHGRIAAILAKVTDARGGTSSTPEATSEPPKATDAELATLYDWWLSNRDETFQQQSADLARLEKEEADILARGTVAHVMAERDQEAMAYILFRGEYDQRRDPVKPDTPAALPAMPDDYPRNRLGLARWLLSPEHPLTARVTVNRFWQQVFGTGIVATAGDFGVAGELPTHPELLDWLAIEFREGHVSGSHAADPQPSTLNPQPTAWDIKRLFKLLVMSATYRQSAAATPEKLENDPDNRLLSRGPRFRMDAEMVRDHALAASGLIVRTIGGPSVRPYQPPGVWEAVAMIGSNTRDYRQDTGDALYRRSLYTFWKRSAPPASMDIFNAPSRELCTVRRERTNTPLQALVTLNDTQFVEAARALAERALTEGGETTAAKANFVMQRLLARPLHEGERPIIEASLADLLAYYGEHPEDAQQLITVGESKPSPKLDPATLAAWTMLANELMNLDEVLNK
ncbi:MAG: DUF1553 domain-containing protein [Planctomycetes bacterium]|nr:DUF1553 domain-containing protein [Planctomycetota bacterium]